MIWLDVFMHLMLIKLEKKIKKTQLYLNHINLLPAAVPDLKLPHVSLDVLRDPHSSHLQRDEPSVLDLHHAAHLSGLSNICSLTQTSAKMTASFQHPQ